MQPAKPTSPPVPQSKLITYLALAASPKTFVAVIILQLVEEGRLSLDRTAAELLGAELAGAVPNAASASIAQLLNHTGGIPSWEDDPQWIKEGRGAQQDVARVWLREATLRYIERTSAMNAPGEKYAYANTNHTLLGLVIEKITGTELVEQIRQRVLAPLNLRDIYLEGFQALPRRRLAKRYHYSTPEFIRDAGIHPSFSKVRENLIDASTSNLSVEWGRWRYGGHRQ